MAFVGTLLALSLIHILVPWAYFAQALTNCTGIIVTNQHVITKVYFPRLILPLAAVCSGVVDLAIGFVVMILLTLSFGIHPPATVVLLPIFMILAVLTALGVGLWTSALNALYRDVASIVPFVVQFWMLASPVAYPSSVSYTHLDVYKRQPSTSFRTCSYFTGRDLLSKTGKASRLRFWPRHSRSW